MESTVCTIYKTQSSSDQSDPKGSTDALNDSPTYLLVASRETSESLIDIIWRQSWKMLCLDLDLLKCMAFRNKPERNPELGNRGDFRTGLIGLQKHTEAMWGQFKRVACCRLVLSVYYQTMAQHHDASL